MMESGFQIHEAFYPTPTGFRMGDPVLVEEVTGLSWSEFGERADDPEGDPLVMLGMLAVAVWHTNPRWRRDRVARFVEAINIEDVSFVGDEVEETDAVPPDETDSANGHALNAESSKPQGYLSATNQPSTTPDGSPPTIPVSA